MSEVKCNFIKDVIRFLCCLSSAGLLLLIFTQHTTLDIFLISQMVNQITRRRKGKKALKPVKKNMFFLDFLFSKKFALMSWYSQS